MSERYTVHDTKPGAEVRATTSVLLAWIFAYSTEHQVHPSFVTYTHRPTQERHFDNSCLAEVLENISSVSTNKKLYRDDPQRAAFPVGS